MGWKEKSIGYAICTPDAFICKRCFVVFAQIENINDSIISLLFRNMYCCHFITIFLPSMMFRPRCGALSRCPCKL